MFNEEENIVKQCVRDHLTQLLEDYPRLDCCRESIEKAFFILRECYEKRGKVLVCGNGGSAADSEHIVGELMKGFMLKREICAEHRNKLMAAFPEDGGYLSDNLQGALPAISLVSQSALSLAFINDVAADMVFAQQVYGYAKDGDVLIALSTSGNSKNVVNAVKVARAFDVRAIGFTGQNGGLLGGLCDTVITAPAVLTHKVQEYHISIYHTICAMLEAEYFDK